MVELPQPCEVCGVYKSVLLGSMFIHIHTSRDNIYVQAHLPKQILLLWAASYRRRHHITWHSR